MYEGRWTEASEHFALAQTVDPARPALFRAKLDALRGVAALRRGELENCVACCNESSCIFPLAAAAIHRRTAGSREAIEHFTRYLRQQPEDLGVQWLLNVAYMTLGEYPKAVPPDLLLPLGRFAAAADDPRRMVNVASRVGLNCAGRVDGRRRAWSTTSTATAGSTSSCPRPNPSAGRCCCATAATAPLKTSPSRRA